MNLECTTECCTKTIVMLSKVETSFSIAEDPSITPHFTQDDTDNKKMRPFSPAHVLLEFIMGL